MQATFSIILVTYRRLDFLSQALASVQAQTLRDFECLIYNDWPEDNPAVLEIINKLHDDRFRFAASDESNGANHWRNQGVADAKGSFIAFLDDDDQWFPDKLQKHADAHIHEKAFLVYSDYVKSWPQSKRPNLREDNAHETSNLIQAIARGDFSISTTSSVSIKNELKHRLFDESLPSFQDWDAWFSLALARTDVKFHRIKEPLLCFTQHEHVRVSQNHGGRLLALQMLEKKYQKLKIDITGFVDKQKVNLIILHAKQQRKSILSVAGIILAGLFYQPELLKYKYTYKRIARFLIKRN